MSFLLLGAALISRPAPAQSADAGLPRARLVKLPGDGYAEAPAKGHEHTVGGGGAVPEAEAPGGEVARRSSSISNDVGAKP